MKKFKVRLRRVSIRYATVVVEAVDDEGAGNRAEDTHGTGEGVAWGVVEDDDVEVMYEYIEEVIE